MDPVPSVTVPKRCDLDDLALELCPGRESVETEEKAWKCANACSGCKKDIAVVLGSVASKARIAGYPAAADWMDSINTAVRS